MARFQISKKVSLRDTLAEIPRGPAASIQGGLRVLSELNRDQARQISNLVIEEIRKGGSRVEPKTIRKEFGLSEEDANDLAFAMAVMAGVLSARDETAKEFVDAAVDSKFLEAAHSAHLLDVAENLVSKRHDVKEAIEQQSLASEVLPSLLSFDVTTEVRLGFENNNIKRVVPIVVAHLDTDAFQQEVWFQLTKRQVEMVIDDLKEVLDRIKLAEAWSKKTSQDD